MAWLQRSLSELNYVRGAPSGRYDDATLEAVKRFQSEQGLVADGVAGPLTQIALFGQLERYPVPRLSTPAVDIRQVEPPSSQQERAGESG